jgi:hypothetical protein
MQILKRLQQASPAWEGGESKYGGNCSRICIISSCCLRCINVLVIESRKTKVESRKRKARVNRLSEYYVVIDFVTIHAQNKIIAKHK